MVDYKESTNRFFVRTTTEKEKVEAVFGAVEYVEDVVAGEYAFTTSIMTESDFANKAEQIQVINRIRLG